MDGIPYTYNEPPIHPQNYPFPWGIWTPHLIHGSLDPSESTTQMASRSVQLFLQGSRSWHMDRLHYLVCKIGRVHVRSTAMWPNNCFTVNLVLSLRMKEGWKSVQISSSYYHEFGVFLFWDIACGCTCMHACTYWLSQPSVKLFAGISAGPDRSISILGLLGSSSVRWSD